MGSFAELGKDCRVPEGFIDLASLKALKLFLSTPAIFNSV
jgi:hypothetical protein